ncbi:MAG: MFS transporter [Ardenticatenales bacterium]|nr:MFS transporter [Ardenticatenales bacterium]
MSLYLLGSALFTFAFATVNSLNMVVAMAIWMSFFTLGAWGALYAYTPEAYPTTLRGTGMGGASGMARIAGVIAPILGGILVGQALSVPLTVYAASFALAGLAALLLPRETNDQPLQDTLSQTLVASGD